MIYDFLESFKLDIRSYENCHHNCSKQVFVQYQSVEDLTHCIVTILGKFFSSADFFQNQLFEKNLSGLPSECQTVWTLIRPDE